MVLKNSIEVQKYFNFSYPRNFFEVLEVNCISISLQLQLSYIQSYYIRH